MARNPWLPACLFSKLSGYALVTVQGSSSLTLLALGSSLTVLQRGYLSILSQGQESGNAPRSKGEK